jgi:hypothetical protein
MNHSQMNISLEAVIAASPMLGHPLEDRSCVRNQQNPELVRAFQRASVIPLRNEQQKDLFLVAPLDILVEECDGAKRFHIIETNGTGIGGLTNLPDEIIGAILGNLTEIARGFSAPAPLILVGVSGKESSKHPRHNHLLHEKLLYVEAIKRGLESHDKPVRLLSMARVTEDLSLLQTDQPTVVLGYLKEFLNQLECGADGRLKLNGRPVTAGVNDRFCLNIVSRFGGMVDLNQFATVNRCFATGADKGLAYQFLNEYAQTRPEKHFPAKILYDRADSRASLIKHVVEWVRKGRRVVIKPQGTGLGHGLEFFLNAEEAIDAIIDKIDHSIRLTEHYYGAVGGAFPYTICEFMDTCKIEASSHVHHGHRYELRVVVYRDGMNLCGVPSIAKVASQGYDADQTRRLSLINNITTSAEAKKRDGTEFMLPLSNQQTLDLLKITHAEMESLCHYCTGYMRHILDQLQRSPARFGLEPRYFASPGNMLNTPVLQSMNHGVER